MIASCWKERSRTRGGSNLDIFQGSFSVQSRFVLSDIPSSLFSDLFPTYLVCKTYAFAWCCMLLCGDISSFLASFTDVAKVACCAQFSEDFGVAKASKLGHIPMSYGCHVRSAEVRRGASKCHQGRSWDFTSRSVRFMTDINWWFLEIGVPSNHPFLDGIFHCKPSILDTHIYGNLRLYIPHRQGALLQGNLRDKMMISAEIELFTEMKEMHCSASSRNGRAD